ncbi:outer membrane beta-barrel family protein [Dysgonomonas massiliensis]|uniref:outer membrane beta-barrel family protein n=1 Tax=Dysgonomonas massiliensis TaxID=2040292 RepID=UPI001FE345D7|nr:outer membrane beta-barrel family protein [Dysgonomonas massiliensis]
MMHNRLLALVVTIVISTTSALFAQSTTYTIKGTLTDSLTREAIAYATVKISKKETPEQAVKAIAADENGRFSLTVNQGGNYILNAFFVGKKDLNKELSLDGEKLIDLGIVEMVDKSETLEDVVVTAAKPLVKVDLDKITYSIEDDPEAKASNVIDMLKKVPMVTVDGEDNIQLKGSSSFKIYMNGKPSNMISNNPKEVLRSMPANTIKDIEVITDPGAKYDAEGVTGIINIITQKQTSMDGYTATINARAGSYDSYGGGLYLMMKYGKIGFTGNYNYSQYGPGKSVNDSYREFYQSTTNRYLNQYGDSKYTGDYQFGSGELSIEIDTLNLINISFDKYGGNSNNRSYSFSEMLSADNNITQSYENNGKSRMNWGQTTLGADYQRTFKKKDQLLTSSYRYSYNPDDSKSTNFYKGIVNYPDSISQQFTDASMKEHTMQIDFTTPFGKVGKQHTIEMGMKYIIRLNNSISGYEYMPIGSNEWIQMPQRPENDFDHRQDILSAYAGYSFKLKKWGFKTGLRYEATWLKAEFPIDRERDFDADYSNVVPSATVTYQLKPSQTLRAGYNMRIWRPSIWQLNPYENTSNPQYISKGNPNLDVQKTHNLNLNYSFFDPKFNLNANLSYSLSNNGIQSITNIIDYNGYENVSYTSYYNASRNRNVNLSLYANWNPHKKFRIYANMYGSYINMKTVDYEKKLSNSGFRVYTQMGVQYTIPWEIKLSGNYSYFGAPPQLQGKGISSNFHNISVQKEFINKKLTIRAYISNPFKTKMEFSSSQKDDTFYSSTNFKRHARTFGVNVSFRFGELKSSIKKVARGIRNDDTSVGGGGQSQGGESGAK